MLEFVSEAVLAEALEHQFQAKCLMLVHKLSIVFAAQLGSLREGVVGWF